MSRAGEAALREGPLRTPAEIKSALLLAAKDASEEPTITTGKDMIWENAIRIAVSLALKGVAGRIEDAS